MPALGIGRTGFEIVALVMVAALLIPAVRHWRSALGSLQKTTREDWFPRALVTDYRSPES